MSSETFDVNYFKLCIASQIQAGHDMFHDVNPYIPSVHNPSYEAKKAAKIRASYTLPSRTAARLNGDGKDSQQQPLLLQYSMEAENKRNVMSNALVLRSEGESAGSSARAGDGKSTGPAPTAAANSNALITAKKGAQAAKVPVPKWHAPWELSAVISGHLGWVRSIAFDSSNEWFATGAADRTIKIWDLAKCCAGSEGGLRLTLTGHINAVRGLAVSQRHPYLFSVGEDKTVKCWDLEHNKVIRNYHGHLSAVFCCAVHPTLDLLITGGRDSVARVWDMRTKHQIHCLSGHTGAVSSVIANGVDPQIITASHDSTIKLWDIAAGKSMSTLTHHKKAVRSIVASPRELSFVSASADNIKKWQIRDGKFLRNMSGHNAVLNSLAVNDDGVMVSAGDNGSLNFWDYDTGYCFQQSQTVVQPGSLDAEAGIFASTFDLSGSRLLTCEADKTIKIWKENTDATEDTHPVDMKGWTKDCLALKRF